VRTVEDPHGPYNKNGVVRRACKYLGVWIDGDSSGRTLTNAILEKFKAGVPVFFGLCRRLRIARLDRVYSLAVSLLFSLLYGAEFFTRVDVIQRCEVMWWGGVCAFYGLPNGVSNNTLKLLFPKFSLVRKVLLGKVSLSLRGLQKVDTIFPEALVYDRGVLFESHRGGFVQSIRDWGCLFGLPALFLAPDKGLAAHQLDESRISELDTIWDSFSEMTSTRALARLLGGRESFLGTAQAASRFSRLGLRIFILAGTGSLSQSYLKTRDCPQCGVRFDFDHYLCCPALGPELMASLSSYVAVKEFDKFSVAILSRFQVFLHCFRGGQTNKDEDELFAFLDDHASSPDQTP
jgi:hypothetical protein